MKLFLSGSHNSPLVFFDLQAGFLRVAGTSTMPDAALFYERLAQWLKDHNPHIKPQTDLVFSLRFLNSASIRALYTFLRIIAEEHIPIRVVIMHLVKSENSDVVELLEETSRLLGLPYEIRKEPSEDDDSGRL